MDNKRIIGIDERKRSTFQLPCSWDIILTDGANRTMVMTDVKEDLLRTTEENNNGKILVPDVFDRRK